MGLLRRGKTSGLVWDHQRLKDGRRKTVKSSHGNLGVETGDFQENKVRMAHSMRSGNVC